MELFDLTGKVAMVTGSTKGLGETSAKILAKAGADVAVCGRWVAGAIFLNLKELSSFQQHRHQILLRARRSMWMGVGRFGNDRKAYLRKLRYDAERADYFAIPR